MAVRIVFGSDTTQATRGIDALNRQIAGLGNKAKESLGGGVKGMATGMMSGLLAGFSIGAIKDAFDEFDRLNDLGMQLNETAVGMQQLNNATKLSGTNVEQLGKGFGGATQRVREFLAGAKSVGEEGEGAGKIGRALKSLSIDAGAFTAASLSEQVSMVVAGMEKMESPTLAAGAALALLGTKQKELLPLLAQGTKALEASKGAAMIISEEQVQTIAKANDEVDKLGLGLKAVGAWTGVKALGIGQMLSGLGTGLGAALSKPLSLLPGQAGEYFDDVSGRWKSATDTLWNSGGKNLWGIEDSDSDKREAAIKKAKAEEIRIATLRGESEEKIAELRAKRDTDELTATQRVIALREQHEKEMESGSFEKADKTAVELVKAEKDAAKDRLDFEREISAIHEQAAEEDMTAAEKVAKYRATAEHMRDGGTQEQQYAAELDLEKAKLDLAKETSEKTKKAGEERKAALESIKDAEEEVLLSRMTMEEKIVELRKQANAQTAAGQYKEAAETGKKMSGLIGAAIKSTEGTRGVVSDSLRKVGLGGVAVSASLDRSMLATQRDQLQVLRDIREKIGANTAETFK